MEETKAIRALASADRQLLLNELIHTDGRVTEEELARRVAAGRHQIPPENISEEQAERAHIRLVHFHLPLLLDLDIIEWDNGEVTFAHDMCRDDLLDASELLEEWPPDDRVQHHP